MKNRNSNFGSVAGAAALLGTFAIVALGGLPAQPQKPVAASSVPPNDRLTEVSGFYCNLKAVTPAERAHHGQLTRKLMGAKLETKELTDGYAFRFDAESVSLAELADWVSNEKKCCPFFEFNIQLERDGGALWLKLSGSEGVKPFIRSEFGIHGASEASTISRAVDEWVTKSEELLIPAAEAMPEEKYSFAPTKGEFQGVRTFAEQVKHLAAANFQLGALNLGEKPPHAERGEKAPESVRTKAEIVEYLKASFAYLHRAAGAIDEKNAATAVDLPGGRHGTRVGLLIDALAHSQNHYGQMVEYLRMNGIVPPESR
ncbi:MAG TPA: DinB family protein [Candidatus Sulfotelmatobacter sp.]|nr:DinB family protein [Candidatus Sulfotelmatobacter sp.]